MRSGTFHPEAVQNPDTADSQVKSHDLPNYSPVKGRKYNILVILVLHCLLTTNGNKQEYVTFFSPAL